MKWIVTKDLIDGEENPDAGACKPGQESFRYVRSGAAYDAWIAGMSHEFRLLDDDGTPYYEGVCDDLDNQDGDSAFEPLDWATGYAGCTEMQTRKKGETQWETL